MRRRSHPRRPRRTPARRHPVPRTAYALAVIQYATFTAALATSLPLGL